MILADAIFSLMLLAAPPGKSAWSVEVVPITECAADAQACPGARRSSFYGSWVRKESREHATKRYRVMATALADELAESPDPANWAGMMIALAVNESGLREDVMVGRGRSGRTKPNDKQYDDAGGQGRGPGNEVCVMQILPSMAQKYGGPDALLGGTPEALRLCFRAAIDQLRWARSRCSSVKSRTIGKNFTMSTMYAPLAMYGTGNSCTSSNGGKTDKRHQTALWCSAEIARLLKVDDLDGDSS
jgi:hypothetical protein